MRANTDSRPADRLFGTAAGKEVYRLAEEAIVENKMTEKILAGTAIGFSGGSDSVMLFYVLRKLREEIGAVFRAVRRAGRRSVLRRPCERAKSCKVVGKKSGNCRERCQIFGIQ